MTLKTRPVRLSLLSLLSAPLAGAKINAQLSQSTPDGVVLPSHEIDGTDVVPLVVTLTEDPAKPGDYLGNFWPNTRGLKGTRWLINVAAGELLMKSLNLTVIDGSSAVEVLLKVTVDAPPYSQVFPSSQVVGVAQGYANAAGISASLAAQAAQQAIELGLDLGDIAAAAGYAQAAAVSANDASVALAGAVGAKVAAEIAKTGAELARDAAQLSAGVYPSTAAGITATNSLTEKYFSVPSADGHEYLILYLNSAGIAVEQKRYPSAAAVLALQLSNELGSARQRYLDGLRTAGVTKPQAAVVILLGQSLNAPRGAIVQAKAAPGAKMPFSGTATASWPFNGINADFIGQWDDLATCVEYEERTGQTPGAGIINALLGGKFQRCYIGNCAIGARSLAVLNQGGPSGNLSALLKRLCQQARDDGYAPHVMFYTAHGEADANAGTTEASYYSQGMNYYGGVCQLWAAQAMRKPNYLAPVVFTYPASQNNGGSGNNDRAIKAAIKGIAADLPNGINLGGIYQWPVDTDRVHPTTPSYVMRGEAVGRRLRQFFEVGATEPALHITDVTLSGATFVATFSGPIVRDTTLGVGELLNTALAEDGIEWLDNGVGIAISGLLYQGWKVQGTLASAPAGTLAQQTLRIAVQTTTGALTAGAASLSGSQVRLAGAGWPSISDYTYTNHVYASPQTFTAVRAA